MTIKKLSLPFLAAAAVACVESTTPPEPTVQAMVPYGPKIYLRDRTTGATPNFCRFLGAVTASTSSTGRPRSGVKVDGLTESEAHNCYVEVAAGNLLVDRVETTNNLFQLCVDSGVCRKPDPGNVEKDQLCTDTNKFGNCPVVSVQQKEAARFCEFIGRRLPSGIEHIIMREANNPQVPEKVRKYPYNSTDDPTNCALAVLKNCGKPQPSTPPDPNSTTAQIEGGAKLDLSPTGVYDLAGNASEWSSDLIPMIRADAEKNAPWFCERVLPMTACTACPCTAPVCPSGSVCVKARFRMNPCELQPPEDRPVCVAPRTLQRLSGDEGSVWGANYLTSPSTEAEVGTFTRHIVSSPDADPADRAFGFRCVGTSGSGDAKDRLQPITQP